MIEKAFLDSPARQWYLMRMPYETASGAMENLRGTSENSSGTKLRCPRRRGEWLRAERRALRDRAVRGEPRRGRSSRVRRACATIPADA